MEERASHNSEFFFLSIAEFPFQLSSEALEEGKRLGNIAANFVKGGELEREEGARKCPFFRVPTGTGRIMLEPLMHFGIIQIKEFSSLLTLLKVLQPNCVFPLSCDSST